jgi:hypothetical protein
MGTLLISIEYSILAGILLERIRNIKIRPYAAVRLIDNPRTAPVKTAIQLGKKQFKIIAKIMWIMKGKYAM